MILKRAYYGDPVLRQKAAKITEINDEILQFAKDMLESMRSPPHGSGIAAPQLHRSIAMFVVQFYDQTDPKDWKPGHVEYFINPKILEVSAEGWVYSEGCLSIPGVYADVPRPLRVKIEAQNLKGETFVKEYSGYDARQILHENDHLNVVLFIDRIDPKKRKSLENDLRAVKKKYSK